MSKIDTNFVKQYILKSFSLGLNQFCITNFSKQVQIIWCSDSLVHKPFTVVIYKGKVKDPRYMQNKKDHEFLYIQQNNEILHLFITSAILVNPMDVFSNICINTRKIRVCTSNAKWYNSNNIHFKCSIESDLKQNLSPFMVIKDLKVPTSYHMRIGTYAYIIIAAY